jgi:dihydropteroate synthase
MQLICGHRRLDLTFPIVMGVLNVTPDSFSDGGRFDEPSRAAEQAERMVAAGAAIIDVGGESTRPGAAPVPVQVELERVIPVIERLHGLPAVISIDTRKPEVMRAALGAGAQFVNDVAALRAPGAMAVIATGDAAVCLMHMQGEPGTMQREPRYADVVTEVKAFLAQRVHDCLAAGIARERIVIDPGFGFGKTVQHNLQLLRELRQFAALGVPLLAGLSRKSMIGALTGRGPGERLAGSVALAVLAAQRGARILRAHDVAETADALTMLRALTGMA